MYKRDKHMVLLINFKIMKLECINNWEFNNIGKFKPKAMYIIYACSTKYCNAHPGPGMWLS